MDLKDRAARNECVIEANYSEEGQDNFDELRKLLKGGMVIIEELLEYFRRLKEFEDRDRAKEQEQIGKTLDGSEISRAAGFEPQIGNAR